MSAGDSSQMRQRNRMIPAHEQWYDAAIQHPRQAHFDPGVCAFQRAWDDHKISIVNDM